MQSQSHARDSNQLHVDGEAITTTLTKSGQDAYYSNHDIAMLHAIVTAAQDQLDKASEPLLPAAVLFKAYDDILPDYGIDPDSDYHLSAFVFRIGGEQGHGTLVDKFQAILGRMGIKLEYGDDASSAWTSSSPPSPIRPQPSRPGVGDEGQVAAINRPQSDSLDVRSPQPGNHYVRRNSPEDYEHADGYSPGLMDSVGSPEIDTGTQLAPDEDQAALRPDSRSFLAAGRRTALMSALDLWRNRTAAGFPQVERRVGPACCLDFQELDEKRPISATDNEDRQEFERVAVLQLRPPEWRPSSSARQRQSSQGISSRPYRAQSKEPQSTHTLPGSRRDTPASISLSSTTRHEPRLSSTCHVALSPAHQERLLHRAVRARELYLASKYFNSWADRTALRLEREAVARRHMVRFRCFQGWSEIPSSKMPAAENLRAVTAVQKLRRAVIYQEEQLGLVASAISGTHRVNLAHRVIEKWACQAVEHRFRRDIASRKRSSNVREWKRIVWKNTQSRRAGLAHIVRSSQVEAVHRWSWGSVQGRGQLIAAQHVEMARLAVGYLSGWLQQAELKRQSQACERAILMGRVSMSLNAWNLRAREQAFNWKCEYSKVTSALRSWLTRSTQDRRTRTAAHRQYMRVSSARLAKQIRHAGREHVRLAYLQGGARLFIGGNLLLKKFAKAVQERRTRIKGSIRRYLMLRYTQVSSRRRKRVFFAALDKWWTATAGASFNATCNANGFASTIAAEQCLKALATWSGHVLLGQQARSTAQKQHRGAWLASWIKRSAREKLRNAQAWRLWTLEQERVCFKLWSIATLQRSGQAHTASVARQRHDRETQGRILQLWKVSSRASRQDMMPPSPSILPPSPRLTEEFRPPYGSRHRSVGNLASGRATSTKQPGYMSFPMETPTRWTGLPVPMMDVLSSKQIAKWGQGQDDLGPVPGSFRGSQSKGIRQGRPINSNLTAPPSPSTTPQPPLPLHAERLSRAPFLTNGALDRGGLGRPVRVMHRSWQTPVKPAEANFGVFDPGVDSRSPVSAPGKVMELRRTEPRPYSQSMLVSATVGRRRIRLASTDGADYGHKY